jgi:hypothetical protein
MHQNVRQIYMAHMFAVARYNQLAFPVKAAWAHITVRNDVTSVISVKPELQTEQVVSTGSGTHLYRNLPGSSTTLIVFCGFSSVPTGK